MKIGMLMVVNYNFLKTLKALAKTASALSVLLLHFNLSAQKSKGEHCIEFISLETGKKIENVELYIYKSKKALVLHDDKGEICFNKEEINLPRVDSIIVKHNFTKDRLDEDNLFSSPIYLSTSNELDVISLSAKKERKFGPHKNRSIPYTIYSNQQAGIGFAIDSTIAGKSLRTISFKVRGKGLFIPDRSYGTEFKVEVYHYKDSVNLTDPAILYKEENELHKVDIRGKHFVSVNTIVKDIYIPETGYIVVVIKCVKGSLNLMCYKRKSNPQFTSASQRNLKNKEGPVFKLFTGSDIPQFELTLY
ncbi:hypothetical protein BBFL7_00144 [Flavobacteria bacterium BBFL7]|nr:hypothetical protein BBFL7_00144 [Flavobacteria bacterium BBFL7]